MENFIEALYSGGIAVILGVISSFMGFSLIDAKTVMPTATDEQIEKYKSMLRFVGPVLIVIGSFLFISILLRH